MSSLGVYLNTIYQDDFFIEIEGKPSSVETFLREYKECKGIPQDELLSDGVIRLNQDANKYGLEYRVYLKHKNNIPEDVNNVITKNTVYRPEYNYRISLRDYVRPLMMSDRFRLGYNHPGT